MESDGLGYISTQEHVTPHIGSTGRYFGFSSEDEEKAYSSRKLAKPDYINRCRRKHAKRPGAFDDSSGRLLVTHGSCPHI